MRVIVANDHGAVELKNRLVHFLLNKGFEVDNLGTDSEDSVDYPDMAQKACQKYLEGSYDFGLLLCGTGIGISIAANKIEGIRAALPQNAFAAQMAKEHNNANFLVFGGRIDYPQPPEILLEAFLNATYNGEERHARRLEKLSPKALKSKAVVKHLVQWKLKGSLSPQEKATACAEIKRRLEALNGRIPGLLSLSVTYPLLGASTGDLLLDSTFTNEEALSGYQAHPLHLEAAAYVRAQVEGRSCADYWL